MKTMVKFKLLIFAVLAGSFFYLAWQTKNILEEEVFEHVHHIALIAHNYQSILIDETETTLKQLADEPTELAQDQSSCQKFLTKFTYNPLRNRYLNAGLVNTDGIITCSLLPMEPDLDVSHRRYFQQAISTNDFAIGEYQIGLITKKPSLNFGYPIRNQANEVTGVVFVAMGLDWFEEFFTSLALDQNLRMKVMDRSGTILASVNQEAESPGTQGLNSRLLAAVLNGEPNPVLIADENNSLRAYGFQPRGDENGLPETFIIISKPLGPIYNHISLLFAAASLASIIAGLVIWKIVKPRKN